MQKISFQSGDVTIVGNLYLPKIANPPGVLILHGGGKGNKERFEDLQIILEKNNIASLAIDFRGVGESTGEFSDGSLDHRLQDASFALEELKKYIDPQKLAIFGSSMGGYVAAILAEKSKVKVVALSAAAAYSPDAEDKPLNEQFTNIIRKEKSWENSKSFSALENFPGKVLVIYGEYDAVIPEEIRKRYENIAEKKGDYIIVPNCPHGFMAPKNAQEESAKQEALSAVCDFLTKTL